MIFLFPVLWLLFFIAGSGAVPLLGSDEPRYAEVAREMFQTHDYIVPHLGHLAWFEKPVALYWLMALFYRSFGVNEFAARFPSALAAAACVSLVYLLAKLAADFRTAVAASVILATSAFFTVFSHAATFDMLLTLCLTTSFYFFYRFELDRNPVWLYLMYAAIGFGILAKGFVAPILTALSIAGYFAISKEWSAIMRMRLGTGLIIIFCVTSIWFIPVSVLYGFRFWRDFFLEQQLTRYATTQFHHSDDIFFYIPILLAGTFPWTAALFIRSTTNTPQARVLKRLSFCWFISTLIFFSVSRSKLPSYMLPAIPALAILSGFTMKDLSERFAMKPLFLFAFFNAVMIAALFWLDWKSHLPTRGFSYAAIAISVITALALAFAWLRKPKIAFFTLSVTCAVLTVIFVFWICPYLRWEDSKKLALEVLPELERNQKITVHNVYDYVPLFYTNGRMELLPDGHLVNLGDYRQLSNYLSKHKQTFLMISNSDLGWISGLSDLRILHVWKGRDISIAKLEGR